MAEALPVEGSGGRASLILEKYEDDFIDVVNPKLKLRWLKRKKVLTDSLITDIESADNENAVELLFEHLRLHADVATLWKYCKMVITADAYPKMQELGKKMLSELPPEVSGQASGKNDSQAEAQESSGTGQSKGHEPQSSKCLQSSSTAKELSFKELDVDGLYHVLEKELGADMATVIQKEEISGEDLLDLTEDEVEKMFSKLGQKKKVLRLIKGKRAQTTQATPSTGQNSSPLADQHSGARAVAQIDPASTASYGIQVGISGKFAVEPPHTKRSASVSSAEENSRSSPVAQKQTAGNRIEHYKLEEMAGNLDKLSSDDLFLLLSEKVDQEAAAAIRDQRISGSTLVDLTDTELKDLLPKLGPRKMVKRLVDNFQSDGSSQPKGAPCPTPKPVVSPVLQVTHSLPPQRLALRVKDKSECIQTGRQKIYSIPLRLVMHDRAKGVAKYQYGTPRSGAQEYVVMLVGATGAGKATLINGITNFLFGVQWEDDFRFQLILHAGVASLSHSNTQYVTAYTIHKQEGSPFPHTLTIVATPGYGDTKGIESDKRIVDQIRAFLSMPAQEGIDHIHAVGFVTQASLVRLTPTQKNVFDSILAVFGKDVEENILMMITFADGKKPPVLVAVDEAGIHYCRSFKFNNSVLFADEASGGQEDEGSNFDKMFWDMGVRSFAEFFKQLTCMEARSLQLTKEVLEERKQLELIMQSLQTQIQAILGKFDTLQQEELIMKKHEAEIDANRNFTYTVTEPRIVRHDTVPGQYVTNCLKCNFTCHKPCDFANNDDKRYCSAMSGEYCRICPKKCHWSCHVNNPFWFELTEVTVRKTFDELKKRYEAAMTGKSTKEGVVSTIRADIAARYHEAFHMTRQAQQILHRLDEIALRPNPLNEVEYIDLLIQSEEIEGKDGYKQRIECLKTVRKQAQLLSTVKDEKIFENEAMKKAQRWLQQNPKWNSSIVRK